MAYAKTVLRVKKKYEHLRGQAPIGIDANVLTQGFPGGQRHIAHDWVKILREWGYRVNEQTCSIYKINSDEILAFHGITLREALKEAKERLPELASLYRISGKDPLGDTQCFVDSKALPLSAREYLLGPVSDVHREASLDVSRFFRKTLGRPLNEATKWSQTEYGQGYVAYKFPVVTDLDVYHCGAGGWFGQSARGIVTPGRIRCTDPLRDGSRIEVNPPETVCVSDCSYGDGEGMSNVQYFYTFYQGWINQGKQVYFKGDICYPPTFPCKVISTTRPHNREFIGYADSSVVDKPDYAFLREQMNLANVERNKKSLRGDIKIPDANVKVIEDLLYTEYPYHMSAPKTYDLIKKIASRSRFAVQRKDFLQRMSLPLPGRAFTTVSASIFVYVLATLNKVVKGKKLAVGDAFRAELEIMDYPYLAAHAEVEEIVWGFERCASYLGIERKGTKLVGSITDDNRKNFLGMLQDFVMTA